MKRLKASDRFQKRTISFLLLLYMLFPLNFSASSADSQSATVKEILAQPQSYQLHTVTLHGTVTNLQKVPPEAMDYCINRHTFTLTDETGSIQVFVVGNCANLIPLPPEVKEGEVVSVEGTVQVTVYPTFPRLPNKKITGAEQGVRVLAQKIWPQPETVQGRTSKQPHGKIDFETFRLISTGMTREEVFKIAGTPTDETYKGCLYCSSRWVYDRDDGWMVEVTFSKYGQAASVTSARQR